MDANPTTSVVCFPYLGVADCDRALGQLSKSGWTPGGIARPGSDRDVDAAVVRACQLHPVVDEALLERLETDLLALNARHYAFDVEGFGEDDPVTVMRYGEGDHFVWHIDNGAATRPFSTRKLSFSLQLSDPEDYDGGDLQFAVYSQDYGGELFAAQRAQTRARGALIVFPSFHLHRVAPVTRGARHAIVGWLHGPAFR